MVQQTQIQLVNMLHTYSQGVTLGGGRRLAMGPALLSACFREPGLHMSREVHALWVNDDV